MVTAMLIIGILSVKYGEKNNDRDKQASGWALIMLSIILYACLPTILCMFL
jgi:hypothetical protein